MRENVFRLIKYVIFKNIMKQFNENVISHLWTCVFIYKKINIMYV